MRLFWWLFAGVLVAAAAVRAGVLILGLAPYDADSAITGLMARHMLGGEPYLFYAGQRYMGSLEQADTALAFGVGGENAWTLRIVGILLALVICALTMLVVRRIASDRRALVAGLVLAVGPGVAVLYSLYPRGAHSSVQVVGMAVALLCFRGRPFGAWRMAAIGALTVTGVWLSVTSLVVLVPLLLWFLPDLVAAVRSSARAAAATEVAVLLGAWWAVAAALSGGWTWSIVPTYESEEQPYATRLVGVLAHQVPQALGVESTSLGGWRSLPFDPLLPGVAGWCFVLPAYAGLLVVAVRHRRQVAAWWSAMASAARGGGASADRPAAGAVVVVLLAMPLVVALSPMSWRIDEPRYLVAAFPWFVLALVLTPLRRVPSSVRVLLAAVLVVGSASSTVVWVARESAVRAGAPSPEQCTDAAADVLAASGVDHVAGSYWQVEPLDLAGHGRYDVRQTRLVTLFLDHRPAPDAPGTWALAADEERERAVFAERLTGTGHTFTETTCGDLTVFTGIEPALTPAEIDGRLWYNPYGN